LRLTLDDTELTGICETTVEVREASVLTDIVVTPDPVIVEVGGTQSFTAACYDQYGDPMACTPGWTATGGTIDPNPGVYTAGLIPGIYEVIATEPVSGIFGTATVEVTETIYNIDIPVASSSDDAEESAAGGMSLGSSDLELILETTEQTVGIRFAGLDIPNGANILTASVQFTVDEVSTDPTSLTIEGQAHDNAPTFTTTNGDISSRTLRTGAVDWLDIPQWTIVGEAGPAQQTPDIKTIIKEVVDRPGWTSGSSVVLIITGTGKRVAESFNGTAAPVLHVEYTTAPPVLTDIVVTPDPAAVVVGGTQQFTATGYDQYGAPMALTPEWKATGGTIDLNSGEYTAGSIPGFFEVTATDPVSGIFGMATVEVREASVLTDIVVTPDPAAVEVGGSQSFTATGYDQYGAPMALTPEWTATGGTIDLNSGEYTAGSIPGFFEVTSTDPVSGCGYSDCQ
jgi:hypothetical protein